MLWTKNLCEHAFELYCFSFSHGFLGQTGGGKKLHRETLNQQVPSFEFPSPGLQMLVDRGNARGEAFIGRNEENVGIVRGEGLNVVNSCQGTAEGPIFNDPGSTQIVAARMISRTSSITRDPDRVYASNFWQASRNFFRFPEVFASM